MCSLVQVSLCKLIMLSVCTSECTCTAALRFDTDQSLYCVVNQHLPGETTIKIALIAFTPDTAVYCAVPPMY